MLRSADVIHGFFIPAFRIKEDVVPKENYTWFLNQLGSFDVNAVICGVSHADMPSRALVVPVEVQEWYFGDETCRLGRTINLLRRLRLIRRNVLNQFCSHVIPLMEALW